MSFCKIVYVKHQGQGGWRWEAVSAHGARQVSDRSYPLFFECVLAARSHGYAPTPELKCR